MDTKPKQYLGRFYRDGTLLHAQRDTLDNLLALALSSGNAAEIVDGHVNVPGGDRIVGSFGSILTVPHGKVRATIVRALTDRINALHATAGEIIRVTDGDGRAIAKPLLDEAAFVGGVLDAMTVRR